jgi:ADP-ribose pyrophosphatase YjhB (NUDIX family)
MVPNQSKPLFLHTSVDILMLMGKAARAIVIKGNKLLLMHRNKRGHEYFTLVGGLVKDGETLENGLAREVKEETGLKITSSRLVFVEKHPAPHNDQYIFLAEVGPHDTIALEETSEEALMNRIDTNSHRPFWGDIKTFSDLPFLTIKLQKAISQALQKGFPSEPTTL